MVTAKKTSTSPADVAPKSKAPAKKSAAVKTPAAVAKPAAAEPKLAVKKSPAKKAPPAKAGATTLVARPAVTPEQRHHYIEVAAFYVAQRRDFAPGNPVDDWATAEQEVDHLIALGNFSK
ncbi:MAG: DUF2934 domain-containing protein [Rhodoferax sp.]|nr:DUF2934 domain-containing protein [Rhodoferax sp.]